MCQWCGTKKKNTVKHTFITIPEQVEAIQWLGNNIVEVQEFTNNECTLINNEKLFTHTDYGPCLTSVDDYIVKKDNVLSVFPTKKFKEQFITKEEWKKKDN